MTSSACSSQRQKNSIHARHTCLQERCGHVSPSRAVGSPLGGPQEGRSTYRRGIGYCLVCWGEAIGGGVRVDVLGEECDRQRRAPISRARDGRGGLHVISCMTYGPLDDESGEHVVEDGWMSDRSGGTGLADRLGSSEPADLSLGTGACLLCFYFFRSNHMSTYTNECFSRSEPVWFLLGFGNGKGK